MRSRYFEVEVCGQGFYVPTDDGGTTEGFIVICYLEADDENDACDKALRSIVENPDFEVSIGCHADEDTAEIFVERWVEIDSLEGCTTPHGSYVFYGATKQIQ